ncbi:MAG: triose-phosphate isomerase [Nitrososphaerales archaeon]
MLYFVINTKNYPEASGTSVERLAHATYVVSQEFKRRRAGLEIIISIPAFSLGALSRRFEKLPIFTQHLDNRFPGSTTGFLVPEIAKLFGADGSILNHSEHRISEEEIKESVERLRKLGMRSLVCARDEGEIETFARYSPDFLAIEPPELIGSGNAVSKARPEIISNSSDALRKSVPHGSKTVLLCGAGIIDPVDAQRAVELGAEGILVASGVVKAANWKSKIHSLSEGLTFARGKQGRKARKV